MLDFENDNHSTISDFDNANPTKIMILENDRSTIIFDFENDSHAKILDSENDNFTINPLVRMTAYQSVQGKYMIQLGSVCISIFQVIQIISFCQVKVMDIIWH